MQDIVFKRIVMKNFRIYSETELSFPEGLIAITGKNGAGKSSYFMAFMVALYGRTAEGIELSDLVNKRTGKNLEVSVEFDIDKDNYVVTRYYQHRQNHNRLMLIRNGEDISKKTTTDTYSYLESLLIPRSVFLNSVYFHQQVKDFFTALTDSKQKEIFDSILQLHEWGDYYKNASESVKLLQVKIDKANVLLVKSESARDEKKDFLKVLKEDLAKEVAENEEEKKECDQAIQDLENKIKHIELKLEECDYDPKELDDIVKKVAVIDSQLEGIDEEIDALVDKVQEQLDSKKTELESQLKADIAEKTQEMNDVLQLDCRVVEEEKIRIQSEMAKVQSKFLDTKTELLTNHTMFKSECNQKIVSLTEDKISLAEKFDVNTLKIQMNDELAPILEKISDAKKRATDLKTKASDLDEELKTLNEELQEVKKSTDVVCDKCGQSVKDTKVLQDGLMTAITSKNAFRKDITQEFDSLKSEVSPLGKKRDALQEKFNSKIEEVQSSLDSEIKRVEEEISKIKIESGNRAKEVEDKIKKLQDKCNETCEELQNLADTKDNRLIELQTIFQAERITFVEQSKQKCLEKIDELNNLYSEKLRERKSGVEKKKKTLIASKSKFLELQKKILRDKDTQSGLFNEKSILEFQLESKKKDKTCLDDFEPDLSKVSDMEKSIKGIEAEIAECKKELSEGARNIKILDFWKVGYSDRGIPSMLIDSSIPFLNEAIRKELDKVAPGKFIVTFDTVSATKTGEIREKFAVIVLNTENGADNHKLLSGGEKRLIDVCCMRVLRLLVENLYQKRFNINLMDEVLDSLDEENSSQCCRYLKTLTEGQNVTLITHSISQNSECDSVMRI